MEKGVQADRDTHRVRGPDRGAQQDEPGHRPGSGLDGAAAPDDGAVRPHLAGLPVYKMTGSGNDIIRSRGTIQTASRTMARFILLCPSVRSTNTMGISVSLNPFRHALTLISIWNA